MEKRIQCYMSKYLLLALMGSLPFASQNDVERYVLRKHDNGKPYVVFFCKGADNEKVKEELYYPSGQLENVGHFQNGLEHGEWIYYWPNGKVKSFEYYEKGKEEGLHYDCNEKGKRIRETEWKRGVMVSQRDV